MRIVIIICLLVYIFYGEAIDININDSNAPAQVEVLQ